MTQHHRARPDLADRIRHAFAGNVWSRSVNWLEHRGELSFRIQMPRRRNADRPDNGWSKIREDVAEQIVSDNHVKPVRMTHEVRGKNINMELIGSDTGIFLRNCRETFVPKRHCVNNPVRLGRRGHMLTATACQLECVPHDTVATTASENRLLDGQLILGVGVEPATDFRVFSFVIFTHHAEIDHPRSEVLHRWFNSREQTNGPNIRVLTELAADRNQQAPERDVIWHPGMAHGAEKNGIEGTQLLEAIFGHHAAGLEICLTAPVEGVAGE